MALESEEANGPGIFNPLAGKTVFIVEDSPLIAAFSDDMIRGFGCSVIGPAHNMAEALELGQIEQIDLATVDLNIRGGKAFPLLRILRSRNIPFLITSGYADWSMPVEFEDTPRLAKPYSEAALRDALLGLI